MTDSDVALHRYGHHCVDRTSTFITIDSLRPYFFASLTCHGYLSDWEQVGDGGGETQVENELGEEKWPGEHYEGGNQIDHVVDAERDHQSGKKFLSMRKHFNRLFTCRNRHFFS